MSRRAYITLAIIIGVIAVLMLLQWLIPGAQLSPDGWIRIIYLLGFLALIGGGVASRRRIGLSEAVTYSGIWIIIILALMIGHQLWEQH